MHPPARPARRVRRRPAAARRRPRRSRRCARATRRRSRSPASDATVANVARALDGADSAHVAAHGRFRDDNPLFMQPRARRRRAHRLRPRAPAAASRAGSCSRAASPGLSRRPRGRRADGLHRRGLRARDATVIAAVVPVPDEATKGLMLALDEELSRGVAARRRHWSTRATRSPDDRRAHARRSSASARADYPGAR